MYNYEALDIETIIDNNIVKPICIAITHNKNIQFKRINIEEIDSDILLNFMLEKCSPAKIYYVHNLTFEVFVFLHTIIKRQIKFKIISANKIVYSIEIYYKKKKIQLRCSYQLTMLPLKKFVKLAQIENKKIFPYKLLNINLNKYKIINDNLFNNYIEYKNFFFKHGKKINIFKILEDYCINDTVITKKAIIKY